MSAYIYRLVGSTRELVAEFKSSDDALLCFKSMAYDLEERLVMVAYGRITVTHPRGCCQNGCGEYVLNPVFREDSFHRV